MINREDVDKLTQLARVEMTPEEKDSILNDLESILGYVSELAKAPNKGEEVEHGDRINIFREDRNPIEAGTYTDKILANAPRAENGHIVVKQIIGEKGERK